MGNPLIYILGFLFITWASSGQSLTRIDGSGMPVDSLDYHLQRLHTAANVHGMTVSIVTSDSVLFQKAYGSRNLSLELPLKTSHNFYAASLSKPLFAYIVMKLVESGSIDLDTPLVEYLDRPLPTYEFRHDYEGFEDIAKDDRHKKITARMCLSHTSGFPNWRYIGKTGIKMNRPLEIESDPGTQYSYSGEGIQLLQFVIEQVTGKNLEELAQGYVFKPLGMPMTSFTWQERFEDNFAVGHYKKRKTLERRKRDELYAAGSMDTTPEDYAAFIQAMLGQEGLSAEAYAEMFEPQVRIHSLQQFGNKRFKTTDRYDPIKLSYGLGWGLYYTPYGQAVFKEGHIEGWEHYAIFYPKHKIGLVIMTNSSNGESIFKEVVELALGDNWMPWYWENYIPYNKSK
jgi:CubicO group peptidase (beta-lactamase class C family)